MDDMQPYRSLAEGSTHDHDDAHAHIYYSVLFPTLSVVIGIAVHFVLSRYLHHAFPYTATMFLIGTVLGTTLSYMSQDSQFRQSLTMWANIDGHLLLMVFLPGLLFKDAFALDIHLFKKAFGQCVTMAFPEVLAGTALVAVVLTYVFPYGTTFIYAMVLGSILSATDPVAVSALLNEVGAPPRLKTHISGESLLNDGAAIVFFNIFYNMDLYQFTGGQYGQDFDWASGIGYFCKLSLGSMGLGIALGILLIFFLWLLRRRYNAEENVVQIMTTLGFAYLSFYIGEGVLHMSGVITLVFMGIVAKAYGSPMINDQVGMEKFWDLLEHVLNTVLFTLGGLVWGTVLVGERVGTAWEGQYKFRIQGREWGYLFALYFFLLVIRSFMIAVFYPCVSRIGLKSNWQESVFMSWGGLRGAVGIALGILLENQWKNVAPESLVMEWREEWNANVPEELQDTPEGALIVAQYASTLWFFFAGGISFLTLVINGSTAGPLLKKLGLANTKDARKSIIVRYRQSMIVESLKNLLFLLGIPIFSKYIDYGIVRQLVPYLQDASGENLRLAFARNMTSSESARVGYHVPNLSTVKPYFSDSDLFAELADSGKSNAADGDRDGDESKDDVDEKEMATVNEQKLIEMRKVFMALLRNSYEQQVKMGFVDSRSVFLVSKLSASVSKAEDMVANGGHINDFEESEISLRFDKLVNRGVKKGKRLSTVRPGFVGGEPSQTPSQRSSFLSYKQAEEDVGFAIACMNSHMMACDDFKLEFFEGDESSPPPVEGKIVLRESRAQVELARMVIKNCNQADVRSIANNVCSSILLNEMVHIIGSYVDRALLNSTEAEELIHPLEKYLKDLSERGAGESTEGGELAGVSHNNNDDGNVKLEAAVENEEAHA